MKAFKKIVLSVLVSCLLLVPLTGTAQAAALFDPDNMNSILSFFGIDTSNPESIQDAIDEIREGGLSGIMNLLGINVADILDELEKYLGAMTPPTLPTLPQETTTAEPEATTEEPTTEAPTTMAPPPVYTPTYPSYTYPTLPPTTLPPVETTTFQFIPPEQIYTEAFTTTIFKPIVEDDVSSVKDDTNPVKTAIGVLLLLGSGIGVVIVVLALKRNRI